MATRKLGVSFLRAAICAFCLVLVASGNLFAAATECRAFDEFGDLNCEDLSARLDNYSNAVRNAPDSQATIIFYEGKYRKGRNPRHGEARAYAARLKDYLVNVRGMEAQRIKIVDGGYRAEFAVQLYYCPQGITPSASPTLGPGGIKFKSGRISKREYKWSCL